MNDNYNPNPAFRLTWAYTKCMLIVWFESSFPEHRLSFWGPDTISKHKL